MLVHVSISVVCRAEEQFPCLRVQASTKLSQLLQLNSKSYQYGEVGNKLHYTVTRSQQSFIWNQHCLSCIYSWAFKGLQHSFSIASSKM